MSIKSLIKENSDLESIFFNVMKKAGNKNV